MGFGLLFIGYFLLLNVVFPGLTNLISALIMLLGLSKLRVWNRGLDAAYKLGLGFAVFSAFDLIYAVLDMLMPTWNLITYAPYVSMVRYLILSVFTYVLLLGIEELAREVKLRGIPKRCRTLGMLAIGIYGLAIIFEAPFFTSMLGNTALIIMAFIILAMFIYVIPVLYLIYTCFARIGMPGEEHTKKEKSESRFSFINEMREKKAERAREDAEYKLLKMQKKKERKEGKK